LPEASITVGGAGPRPGVRRSDRSNLAVLDQDIGQAVHTARIDHPTALN